MLLEWSNWFCSISNVLNSLSLKLINCANCPSRSGEERRLDASERASPISVQKVLLFWASRTGRTTQVTNSSSARKSSHRPEQIVCVYQISTFWDWLRTKHDWQRRPNSPQAHFQRSVRSPTSQHTHVEYLLSQCAAALESTLEGLKKCATWKVVWVLCNKLVIIEPSWNPVWLWARRKIDHVVQNFGGQAFVHDKLHKRPYRRRLVDGIYHVYERMIY